MSKRTRTIQWFEGKIMEVISKRAEVSTYLGLSALSVGEGIRNHDEQYHFDVALQKLISTKKQIKQQKDQDGFTIYKLAA